MSGNDMAMTMNHSQRFRPPRETAIPPRTPPTVKPMMPIVPCTKPTSEVVRPKPPSDTGSTRNRGHTLVVVLQATGRVA